MAGARVDWRDARIPRPVLSRGAALGDCGIPAVPSQYPHLRQEVRVGGTRRVEDKHDAERMVTVLDELRPRKESCPSAADSWACALAPIHPIQYRIGLACGR